FFAIHLHHAQILDGLALMTHVSRKMLPRPHPRREGTGANASRRAMEHGTVGSIATTVMPALDAALKSLALTHAGNVHEFARRKAVHEHAVADFGVIARLFQTDLAQHAHRREVGLFEMAGHGLRDALWLHEFDQTQLHRVVAVGLLTAALHDDTRSRLQHRAGHGRAIVGKHPRHAQLDSDNSLHSHANHVPCPKREIPRSPAHPKAAL